MSTAIVLSSCAASTGERRLVVQGGRELGVLGQLAEGAQLAVGERAQQVGDGGEVARLLDTSPRSIRSAGPTW